MKLLVCGGRDFDDYDFLRAVLSWFTDDVHLAHGGARGADQMAGCYAINRGWPVRVFPADWKRYPRAAGPIRNQQMLDEFRPDLVVAFPGGRGTADMVRRARKANVIVMEPTP